MKRLVFALLILFCGNDMSAQTYTKEVCVRFPVASSVLNPNFGDNAAHPINQGDYAYSFVSLKRKNFISVTPLKAALNALILALNDSAKALVALLTKKFKTSS